MEPNHRDVTCEIHYPPVVSESDEGAYVLAWTWVDREDADLDEEEDEEEAASTSTSE